MLQSRYIFVTGGVMSSLGKGICASGIAALLQSRGFTTRLRKLDPYLNVDPGTMSPYQHGEVFVTDDGAETDLDLGHYERFSERSANKRDSISMGRINLDVLNKERRGDYLGATVQIIPHVTDEIKAFITEDDGEHDFVILEVGGTVGDMEAQACIEAIRQLRSEMEESHSINVHLTFLPWIGSAGELKTKPTQHSVRQIQAMGIQPDILMCRCDRPIPADERRKLASFCNLAASAVVEARDVASIYDIPEAYHAAGLDAEVLKAFGIHPAPKPRLAKWSRFTKAMRDPKRRVQIAMVGKYTRLKDAYKSIDEAFVHAATALGAHVSLSWIDAEALEEGDAEAWRMLRAASGVLVPGGFGDRGIEGKIQAVTHARTTRTPFLGICLGLQMAVIEAARNLAGIRGAASTEFGDAREPVVALMREWMNGDELETRAAGGGLGGTMRLGAYPAVLAPGSRIADIYGRDAISERHRHRYEVNTHYRARLEAVGLRFSATSPDGLLPEAVELSDHPYFVGVQYHPELKSRPFAPHPLFETFVAACLAHAEDTWKGRSAADLPIVALPEGSPAPSADAATKDGGGAATRSDRGRRASTKATKRTKPPRGKTAAAGPRRGSRKPAAARDAVTPLQPNDKPLA